MSKVSQTTKKLWQFSFVDFLAHQNNWQLTIFKVMMLFFSVSDQLFHRQPCPGWRNHSALLHPIQLPGSVAADLESPSWLPLPLLTILPGKKEWKNNIFLKKIREKITGLFFQRFWHVFILAIWCICYFKSWMLHQAFMTIIRIS